MLCFHVVSELCVTIVRHNSAAWRAETSLTEHKDNAAAGREDVSRLGEQLAALESSHAEALISNQRLEQHVQVPALMAAA
jgi:hypothetical protein